MYINESLIKGNEVIDTCFSFVMYSILFSFIITPSVLMTTYFDNHKKYDTLWFLFT